MKKRYLSMLGSAVLASVLILASQALAQQKTAKQCNDEWTAKKAEIQASGQKKKDFIAECRGTAAATPPAASPSPSAKAPPAAAPSGTSMKPGVPAAAGQFATEAQAKGHCPGDTIVWANLDSKIYHFSGNKNYGNTKKGAYMCEKDTAAGGFRAAANEKHP